MLVLEQSAALARLVHVHRDPGIELCLAMWTAGEHGREPLGRLAVRVQEQMRTGPRRSLATLNEKLPGWPLDLLHACYRLQSTELGEVIGRLAAEPPRRVVQDLLISGCDGLPEPRTDADGLELPSGGGAASAAVRRLRLAIVRPEETVLQILDVLEGFVAAGYGRLWNRHREQLGDLAGRLSREVATDPLRALSALSPRAVLEPGHDRITFVGGQHGGVIRGEDLERLDFVPSYWLRRRFFLAKAPRRAALIVGGWALRREVIEPAQMSVMLAALGDERRYAILQLCLRRPRTTSELAPVLGITQGPVSRHLKELERGGLLSAQRAGRRVLYSTEVEALHLLARELQGLTRRAVEDLALEGAA